ncbi:carbohydrate ABC transporter permease [Streptomyces sp. DSM 15324]|uniref:carbohydrate ABC transporter permease n=1 Tax=Streptomyces sp. DSM 15324 TaxID=1739111 RepID=UPI0007473794|nr:carbohydrate ABC transporter permease [Streptomyces sp. DSM 15324]KUO07358.1 ABC transporter permease [Streptomyces sp. DSM 15324]
MTTPKVTLANRDATAARRGRGLMYGLLILLAALFLAPLVWNLLYALKSRAESSSTQVHIWPQHAEWGNFHSALALIDFFRYTGTTIMLATTFSLLVTASSSMVGFGFARLRGRGRKPLFSLMLATTMVPQILTVIPTYVIFSKMGLINTYWPWVLWGLAASPFHVFLYRQAFAGLPRELEEAAILDGCGYFRIYWQIFLPLVKPVIATSFILAFTWVWGDFITPAIFLNGDNTTLGVAMASGYTLNGISLNNVLAAGTVFYVLPVLVLFFFAQRSFTRGVATSGLKG